MSPRIQKILLFIAVGIGILGISLDGLLVCEYIPRLLMAIGGSYIFGAWLCMIVDLALEYKEKINVIYLSIIKEEEEEEEEEEE